MPPTSSGNGSPNRPMAAIWSRTSGSSSPARSIASARGATTSSAKARTILRNSSCSGVSSRSMSAPGWWAALLGPWLPRARGHARGSMLTRRPAAGAEAAAPAGSSPWVVLEAEQGQVVVVAALGVPVDQRDQAIERAGQRPCGGDLLEAGAVDELPGGVARLDQAVGVADQPLALAELALALVGLGAEAEW